MTSDIPQYDIIVIGSGPGGEGASMQAVKNGKKVATIERHARIGGGCTHWGTIPSKALRFAIFRMTEVNNNRFYRDAGVSLTMSFAQLRKSSQAVIDQQVDLRQSFYDRNNVPLYCGQAKFIDPHTIEVCESHEGRVRLQAKHFVLATGSRPYRPPEVDFSHPRIFDSDTILTLNETPHSITVYGAGVVGCEYASMFRNLGVKVNLVNTRGQLLEFLDDEIVDALAYHMRERGVVIRHREECDRVEPYDDGVVLSLKSGKQIKTDILLWANGRTGNSDALGLEALGIAPNSRGHVPVNADFQTTVPHIYAVGDLIGWPSLASAAYDQGRYAAGHIIHGKCERALIEDIPTGIYTSPEISSLGKTERQLTEAQVPYEVGHSQFKSLARAQITGQTVGMLKMLFHR
ncbi:MAG: hypothetical protein JWM11_2505, partial [Planctomycetaceae bacterium]|nr:hypothetical protein [Planctomycetaceae bacterium]